MAAKKIGGGKLTRSETVTVRLDPKLRYLAELAARKHRRTLSSYIEWAIEKSLGNIVLADEGEQYEQTILNQASDLWDVDEADRFVKLAQAYPDLLTHEEQLIWKVVQESPAFGFERKTIDYQYLREKWEIVRQYAFGEITPEEYATEIIPF